MPVTQIFVLFFPNSFFFVYRHSYLEGSCSNGTKTRHVNLVACGPYRVTRSDTGLHDLKHLRKGIFERMMYVLGRSGLGWFHSRLFSGVGCGEWSTVGTCAAQFKLSKQVHNYSSVWPSSRQ